MTKILLPYENLESLDSDRFFRELGKADANGVVDEEVRASDIPVHPLAKIFGEPQLFDQPAPEHKPFAWQKSPKLLETKIGDSVVIAELDENGVVTKTYLKGSR